MQQIVILFTMTNKKKNQMSNGAKENDFIQNTVNGIFIQD